MRVLNKIKEYGIIKSLKIVRAHMIETINSVFFCICKVFHTCEDRIILESEGDLVDNAYALYDYMQKNRYLEKFNVIWLVDDVISAKKKVFQNTKCVEKYPKHISIKRSYYLATCRWYIYDHCNVMAKLKKRDSQVLVYLSHGWGYKVSKGGDSQKNISRADFITATGELSAIGLAEYWNEPIEKLLITGYPRIDYFYQADKSIKKKINQKWAFYKYRKVVFWMPTFRQSRSTWLSEDYIKNETGLPIFETVKSLQEFDEFLKEKELLLVFKLHHLQAELPIFTKKFNNIVIIRDYELCVEGVQLYQLVAMADAVISDYSSITIDFLPMNRPLIYTLDDYDAYNQSRGLFPQDAINYMPGYHVYNIKELKKSIEEISSNLDRYMQKRMEILPKYHKYLDGMSSSRVLDVLGIKIDDREKSE